MLKDIKYVLNNENGSPNLENLIGFASASIIVVGIFLIGRVLYGYFYTTPTIPTVDGDSDNFIVIGYHPKG